MVLSQYRHRREFYLPGLPVGTQMDILVFDRSPKPFNEDIVVTALLASPADLYLLILQPWIRRQMT